jgi:hypothetical protein
MSSGAPMMQRTPSKPQDNALPCPLYPDETLQAQFSSNLVLKMGAFPFRPAYPLILLTRLWLPLPQSNILG